MRQKHRQIKDKETVSYTLKLPGDLYTEIRKVAFNENISIAYLMQTAIEGYVEEKGKVKKQG